MQINKEGKIFIGSVGVLLLALVAFAYVETRGTRGTEAQNSTPGVTVTTEGGKLGDLAIETEPVKPKVTKPTMNNKVQAIDEVVGTGAEAVAGKSLTVKYLGTFTDGKKFDGGTYTFTLGTGNVIQGWHIGIAGMRVGGKRKLIIPPEFAYGKNVYGPIPGNSTLVFEVELLDVK